MAKRRSYQSQVFRAKGVRLVFSNKEGRNLLTSPEVTADLVGRAEAIVAAADAATGGKHVIRANGNKIARRSRVAIITADAKAVIGSAKENTLVRSLTAGKADPPGNPPPPGAG